MRGATNEYTRHVCILSLPLLDRHVSAGICVHHFWQDSSISPLPRSDWGDYIVYIILLYKIYTLFNP